MIECKNNRPENNRENTAVLSSAPSAHTRFACWIQLHSPASQRRKMGNQREWDGKPRLWGKRGHLKRGALSGKKKEKTLFCQKRWKRREDNSQTHEFWQISQCGDASPASGAVLVLPLERTAAGAGQDLQRAGKGGSNLTRHGLI